ncbi:discoidin domain-containing protein [Paenibacillus phytorum]|nr:discoidin domain-containing protein [Paenibacillus phytorum]
MNAKYGLFFHYLAGYNDITGSNITQWNSSVNTFDVNAFANNMEAAGAGYVVLTLGQNSGYYNSPNATYETLAGYTVGAKTSTRDLPLDLYNALNAKGIKLMLYLPSNAPGNDSFAANNMGLTTKTSGDWNVNSTFGDKWAQVIQTWADRYGDKIAGWWFDGYYSWNGFDSTYAQKYSSAVKHGNPNAIVSFNPGVSMKKNPLAGDYEDYTSGELTSFGAVPTSRWLEGLQWHMLSHLGSGWAGANKSFTDTYMVNYINSVNQNQGVVSMDAAIFRNGSLSPDQLNQMKAIKAGVRNVNSGNLNSITAPADITGAIGSAKTADALGLPKTVSLVTDAGWGYANVTWNVDASNYDPTVKTAQTFTVNGTVTLPTGVANPNNVPLTTSINVTVNKIPSSQMTATATSQETVGENNAASMAIDGNPQTIWHTKWDKSGVLPQSITLNLGGTYPIDKVAYLPRPSGSNGNITGYNVFVSTDGVTFTKVASGTWKNDNAVKVATFDPTEASYVKLEATAGVGGWASAAEINVFVEHQPPTTTDNAPSGWVNQDVTVTLSASDIGSGVANTYYTVDDGAEQTGTTVVLSEEGVHKLVYWSVDKAGNVETPHTAVVQLDKTAPTLHVVLDKTILWPANHQMITVSASVYSEDSLSGIESVVLTSIISNESDNGLGDGQTSNDIQGVELGTLDTTFLLRAERSGEGNGRIYTITYTAFDHAGNKTSASSTVTVPHDKSDK